MTPETTDALVTVLAPVVGPALHDWGFPSLFLLVVAALVFPLHREASKATRAQAEATASLSAAVQVMAGHLKDNERATAGLSSYLSDAAGRTHSTQEIIINQLDEVRRDIAEAAEKIDHLAASVKCRAGEIEAVIPIAKVPARTKK